MNNKRVFVLGAASALLLSVAAVSAQDAAKIQPDKNKVLFENEQVRVLEVKNEPGGTLDMHSHPDHLVYFLKGGKAKFTNADGTVAEMEGKSGDVRWVEAVTHKVHNTGPDPIHVIVVELKESK